VVNHVVAPPRPTDPVAAPYRRRLSLLGQVADLTAPAEPFAPLLDLALAGYSDADASEATGFAIAIEANRRAIGWDVAVGLTRYAERGAADVAARKAEWAFANGVVVRNERFVHVHAALLATPTRALLLVGPSGAGKSTTSVALAHAGLTLYSDDVAILERETRRPISFPRPIKLDERSRALLAPLGVTIPDDKRLRESVARTALPGWAAHGVPGPPLDVAIFLATARGESPRLRPMTGAEAMLRLGQQSLTERVHATGPTVGALPFVNALRCYELTAGDLAATVEAVLDLVG